MPQSFSLEDRYRLREGRVALTGLQALVRLPMEQSRRDRAAGLRVGTLITGYPGSPLGEYDRQIQRAGRLLCELDVIWRPAVNEESAATALHGSQLLEHFPHSRYDGVVGIWYGKSPGVDRSCDAFRHGNYVGTGRHGGVLALAGDDTACKSSTIPGDSTVAFYDLAMPVLYPGNPAEVLELGLHGIALSRYSGLWCALKVVTDVADGGAVFDLPPLAPPRLPELSLHGRPFVKRQEHRLLPPFSVEIERQIYEERTAAALAYVRANRLDRVTARGGADRLGLMGAGKTYHDLVHALDLLGLDAAARERAGIRLYRVGCVAPLEPQGVETFADGLRDLVVVEEKRGLVETQVRQILYNRTRRPAVWGKQGPDGRELFPRHAELGADRIALLLANLLAERLDLAELPERVAPLRRDVERAIETAPLERIPYFCSGCPHNASTRLPEASDVAGGGIGCHAMATWMDRGISWLPQMGGEGACWLGLAPFTDREHVFQNVGDGTFAHSASKSIEACIAADVNMTFKILYNDAVAMTGGQEAVGLGSAVELARQLEIQGARRIVLVTEDLGRYPERRISEHIEVRPRSEHDAVMRELREVPGVTVLIYDQQCAAEKRRERKRGLQQAPPQRVFVNRGVCEGCGDCGVQSNCLSVVPVNTEYGRKTEIHQSSCNLDYSCLNGDCPAFMTVVLGPGAKAARRVERAAEAPVDLPQPASDLPSDRPLHAMLIGIGGTGVVTVDAILTTAVQLDGKYAVHLDQTGLSQKGGAVLSNLIISDEPIERSNRVGAGEADLALAFDLLATVAPDNLRRFSAERTVVVANTAQASTAALVTDATAQFPPLDELRRRLDPCTRAAESHFADAERTTERLFGSSLTSNLFLTGVAYQRGLLPLRAASIEAAIAANGVAVEENRQAFRWGRVAVAEPARLAAALAGGAEEQPPQESARERLRRFAPRQVDAYHALCERMPQGGELASVLPPRIADLILYQDRSYAESYLDFVGTVAEAEERATPGRCGLRNTVARYLFKLMACKDEYEVARLWLQDPAWEDARRRFEGEIRRYVHLHPPTLRRLGFARKLRIGRGGMLLFRVLYALRRLRGTALDLFRLTAHRRMERELPAWYRSLLLEGLGALTPASHSLLCQIAELPDSIRGYEGIKERSVARARATADRLLAQLRGSAAAAA